MNKVLQLSKIDLLISKKSLIILTILSAALGITSIFVCPILIILVLSFVEYSLQPSFDVAEKCNMKKLYGTLPIKKRDVVIGRYFSLLLIMVISSIILTLLGYIALKMNIYIDEVRTLMEVIEGNHSDLLVITGFSFLVGCIFGSIEFCIFFTFSSSKRNMISLSIITILIGLLTLSTMLFNISIIEILNWIEGILVNNKVMFIIGSFCIGIISIIISCIISIIIYSRKEF